MSQVVVVGAGITGLTTALTLFHQGVDVQLLEASERVGGKVLTTLVRGTLIDAGADAFLVREPHMTDLCAQLNLDDALVAPATGAAKVWLRGALRPLPKRQYLGVPLDLDEAEASGLLSPEGAVRAAQDLQTPDNAPAADESAGSLVRRRLGDEVMDHLVAPLLGGINAGNADELSIEAGVPQLAAAAGHDPSLIRSIEIHLDKLNRRPGDPIFLSHPNGIGQIIEALATRLNHCTHLDQPARQIERVDSGWRIHARDTFEAQAVVVATPSFAAAALIDDIAPAAAAMLTEIEYASVVMVTFAFAAREMERLDGSGFLVPRSEGLLMTACSWASSKWEHLGGGPTEYLRVSAGHVDDHRAMEMTDEDLVDRLLEELSWVAQVSAEPREVRVTRWPRSLPQYRPGHLERVAGIESTLAEAAPGVVVAGAAYRGLGLPACVHQGRRAASWAAQWIGADGTGGEDRG